MKHKLFIVASILCSVLLFVSCNPVPSPYSGPDMLISYYTVTDNDWKLSTDQTYGSVSLTVPDITQYALNHGTVLVQIQGAYNGNGDYPGEWYSIPYTSVTDPNNGYQQVYGMSYSYQSVTLDLESFSSWDPSVIAPLVHQPVTQIKVVVLQNP